MKLGDWLKRNQMSRTDFARRIGVSPGAVTLICREHGSWLSRETAERIVAETHGAVTPNDFLGGPTALKGLGSSNSPERPPSRRANRRARRAPRP